MDYSIILFAGPEAAIFKRKITQSHNLTIRIIPHSHKTITIYLVKANEKYFRKKLFQSPVIDKFLKIHFLQKSTFSLIPITSQIILLAFNSNFILWKMHIQKCTIFPKPSYLL